MSTWSQNRIFFRKPSNTNICEVREDCKMHLYAIIVLLPVLLSSQVSRAFVPKPIHPTGIPISHHVVVLNAEKIASMGGIVSPPPSTIKEPDDYSVFPCLDEHVVKTIIPAGDEDGMTDEIFDRLNSVYGFPRFNFETSGELPFSEMFLSHRPSSLSLESLPSFSGIKVLHVDPLILSIPNFFTTKECERYVSMSSETNESCIKSRSPTVGKASAAQRTSTTYYHQYKNAPEFLAKASRLLGLDTIYQWEEPQTVQYRGSERYTWHYGKTGSTILASKLTKMVV
jgi:hypothetical protein